MDYKFYKTWKNKTNQEKRYIEALEKALVWLKKQPISKEVLAVYVKGSLVHREINKDSDIDLFTIVKNKKTLNLFREIRDKYKEQLRPVEFLPSAIGELKKNERYRKPGKQKEGMKGRPDHDTLLLPYFKLVYGSPLNTKNWKVRTEKNIYDNLRSFILNKAIPLYKKKEFGFRQLGKAVMHLVYWEERLKGNIFEPSWKAIKKVCQNSKLLQQTVYLRFHPTKNENVRKKYVQEVINSLAP